MKQIFISIIFLPLLACSNIIKNKQAFMLLNCPKVFFSTEDRIYISNSTVTDDVAIKAELNNYAINKECKKQENIAFIPIDILILAKPIEGLENSQLNFPVYVSLLDEKDRVLETQYFLVSGLMNNKTFPCKNGVANAVGYVVTEL